MPTFRFTRRIPKSSAPDLGKTFRITPAGAPKRVKSEATPPSAPTIAVGKAATFDHNGVKVAGVVANYANGKASVRLAIPDENGILLVSDSIIEVEAKHLLACDAVTSDRKVTVWETNNPITADGTKGVAVKDDAGKVIDYTDVTFIGYGSTFANVTPRDRDGDAVLPGAFTETIKEFKRNPVMLYDHRNSCQNIAGSYTDVLQDDIGLKVAGKLSNSPADHIRNLRFLIMEGHLKTLSMGGIFLYGPDGRTIEKVYLFEISLVAIPANPDALFQSRSLDIDSACKMFGRHKPQATIRLSEAA